MNSQKFRLHWKNHSPNFVTVFTQLLNSESLVDVTLAADGKQIQAHRVVLSACSSYFKELFVSHPCQHPIVFLKDVNFKDLCTVIHFMYYGEVNIEQDQISSILKTAEALHVKGFADISGREPYELVLNQERYPTASSSCSGQQDEPEDTGSNVNKRLRHEFIGIHSKSSQEHPIFSSELKRKSFQISGEDTVSSFRSSSSFESSSVIKSQSSLMEQSSMELEPDHYHNESSRKTALTRSTSDNSSENGLVGNLVGSNSFKPKRNRPLLRQERVRKEIDREQQGLSESERFSPITPALQHILPKSPKTAEVENSELKPRVQTFLQLPTTSQLINKQRSQTILPNPCATSNPSCTVAGSSQSLSFLSSNIPTLAVTPVNSAPNIVIDQYPTILRVVSFEEMNETRSSPTPTLARTPSQGSNSLNTLQVPSIIEYLPDSASQGISRLKVRVEENLRRSVSNPGLSPSSSSTAVSNSTGHCPVLRTGAALGCNYCWNTVDSHGRILRRKTKYHCPDCQANLCIVPCFQEYHEKFLSSNEGKSSGPHSKGPPTSHQLLSKMSSI